MARYFHFFFFLIEFLNDGNENFIKFFLPHLAFTIFNAKFSVLIKILIITIIIIITISLTTIVRQETAS